jgi:hypothetical protein
MPTQAIIAFWMSGEWALDLDEIVQGPFLALAPEGADVFTPTGAAVGF